jgi:methanogenic corrinoid protein MtbC1
MDGIYYTFLKFLDMEDRYACVELATGQLAAGETSIASLYQQVLTPALREKINHLTGKPITIWGEHIRTSIIRTVIECCYPYVIRDRGQHCGRGSVIIFCPCEELHEIGARMAMDFFLLCGFEATFIGANTPQHDIIEAVEDALPEYVAISISNYFNMVAARRTIREIHNLRETKQLKFKIIAGGMAFEGKPGRCKDIGADVLLQTYEEIKQFMGDR